MAEAAPVIETPVTPPAGGAPNATPAPTPSATPAPLKVADWASGFDDDNKGFVQNRGFTEPKVLLDSYRSLEKLLGAPKDKIVRIPEKADDADGWKQVYDKLGRPAKATDYTVMPKEGGDADYGKFIQEAFHEVGLSKAQGEAIAAKNNEFLTKFAIKQAEARAIENTKQESDLKKEWGAAFDQNKAIAQRAAKAFGVDPQMADQLGSNMGFSKLMKFMHSIGEKMGEGDFVTGTEQGGFRAMTPEAARNRIASLKGDADFCKRYGSGDASAKEEMNKLHAFAYPDNA